MTLPNGTTIDQNSAAFLTSIPNIYLTTSTSISQSQIKDTSGWLTTAIAANASAIAAIAAGSLFVDVAGAFIYATNVSLAATDLSVSTLRTTLLENYTTSTLADSRYLRPLNKNYILGSSDGGTNYTTQIYQNLIIGNSYNANRSTFYGPVFFNHVVNSDTTLLTRMWAKRAKSQEFCVIIATGDRQLYS